MHAAASPLALPVSAAGLDGNDPAALRKALARAQLRRKWRAFSLTLPLLVFLVFTLLVPIAALLMRAVENPEVASALPATIPVLKKWDRSAASSSTLGLIQRKQPMPPPFSTPPCHGIFQRRLLPPTLHYWQMRRNATALWIFRQLSVCVNVF